jgi:ABC-2 type transport system permease protein
VSRVLSSAINLVISFIPLFIIMALTGVPLRKSILLLPFVVIFLICLSTGMSLLLSSMHVFFRDTQFLWSILVTIWNFLTPIFYPESIIPAAFLKYYHMNPMYQICYFARTIILNGVSPTPITYLYCFVASFLPLIVGLLIFRKSQDKFALYL